MRLEGFSLYSGKLTLPYGASSSTGASRVNVLFKGQMMAIGEHTSGLAERPAKYWEEEQAV